MGIKKFYRPILGYDGQMVDGGGDAAVESVNGQTGAVVLTAADVGALPDTYTPPAAPVASVNGQTGAVTLTAADVGALPDDTELLTIGTTATTAKAGNYQPTWAQVTGKPTFATVATSGAYSDLSGTPAIPSVDFATVSAIEGDWRGEGVETLGAALTALQAAITP